MDLHGVEVIDKNEQLMYFTCRKYNTTVMVNAAISCAYYGLPLPDLGEYNIDEDGYHLHVSGIHDEFILSLCHKKYPKFIKRQVQIDNASTLLKMIPRYRLGCEDLVVVMKMYESVKATITSEFDLVQFILSYIDKILSEKKFDPRDLPNCESHQLPKIECLTISQNKQIQVRGNVYSDFPYWSFGTRWSLKHEVMIGFLFVHPKFGTICLKDSASTTGCIIIKKMGNDLRDIVSKPVYIDKYCIFSEIFNPNTKVNLEYLFLNFNNIHILGNKRKREEPKVYLKFKMIFHLLSKSNITYSQDKGYHFWVEITNIPEHNTSPERCFLCLPERLIEHWPLLEISYSYTMRFAKELTKITDIEYVRINPKLPQFLLRSDNSAVITPNGIYSQMPKLLFLNSETLPGILKSTGPVNFQAVLKFRKFIPNNSSRTKTSNIPPVFGTIGEKTHILDFQVDKVKTLSLYLNNWERMATPVGLLPGVLVDVRNVMVQKTYCKATALTFLEVVDYNPPCEFQTARLLTEDDWGPQYFFGGPDSVPNGVLVHCAVEYYRVIKLFLKRSCMQCSYMSRIKGKTCVECGGEMKTNCELLVVVKDNMGASKITIKKLEMVRIFLGIKYATWHFWLEMLESVGQYQFQRYGPYVNYALTNEQLGYINRMNQYVKFGENKHKRRLHLLCRKLDNSRNYRKDEPLWYGLKAKVVY